MLPDLLDNFHGVNGTALAAHTPDVGGPWVDTTPGFQINGNKCLQTVNASKAYVETGKATGKSLSAIVNLNGCDPANFIDISMNDDTEAIGMSIRLLGDGSYSGVLYSGAVILEWDSGGGSIGGLLADHVLALNVGPDLVFATLDGVPVFSSKRGILKSVKMTRPLLESGALNALPGVQLKQITVWS